MAGTREYYENQIKYCRGMTAACKARHDYIMAVFYINAEAGYQIKLNRWDFYHQEHGC